MIYTVYYDTHGYQDPEDRVRVFYGGLDPVTDRATWYSDQKKAVFTSKEQAESLARDYGCKVLAHAELPEFTCSKCLGHGYSIVRLEVPQCRTCGHRS